MASYWLTFRLKDDATYTERWDALHKAINSMSSKIWLDSTSFYVFESESGIDQVTAKVKSAITPSTDLAMVGMPDYKSARLVGKTEDRDVFALMPFLKQA